MKKVTEKESKLFQVLQGEERIMQLGVGMTLYFPRPFDAFRPALLEFWQQYLKAVEPKTFTWARLGGGNRSRVVGPAVFKTIEGWLSGTLDPGPTCWISLHDGAMDCMGSFGFNLTGRGRIRSEYDEESSYIDLTFPLALEDRLGTTGLADMLIKLAAEVPFLAGVAGYSFQRSPYKLNALLRPMLGLSNRFLGIEITAAERFDYLAERGVPTVNWLTFVGDKHLHRIGGLEALSAFLKGVSVVRPLPAGAVVISGDGPKLGDANRKSDELDAIRKAYQVLRPIQFVDEKYALDDMDFPGDLTVAWLTRLGR